MINPERYTDILGIWNHLPTNMLDTLTGLDPMSNNTQINVPRASILHHISKN
jgi:hypothetical protein